MQNQLYIFVVFVLNGFLIGIFFDTFRILRRSFKTSDLVTNIEDIAFWLLSGSTLLYSIFKFSKGELRIYIFIGIVLGFSIYLLVFSKTFMRANIFIISICKKLINIILIIPISFMFNLSKKTFLKPILFFFINIRNSLSKVKIFTLNLMNKSKKIKLKKDF